jgi:hypothetical protein
VKESSRPFIYASILFLPSTIIADGPSAMTSSARRVPAISSIGRENSNLHKVKLIDGPVKQIQLICTVGGDTATSSIAGITAMPQIAFNLIYLCASLILP